MTYPANSDDNAHPELVAGKYQLTRLVGQGGMGAVWEGVHTSLGTRVAVKFIESQYLENAEARTRFENEARAAAALTSRHVVQVFDHGVMRDGTPYIVMEFLSGEPLDKRLDRVGRLGLLETSRIIVQVSRALAKAHQAGIVHRDLKPENVFLVWDAEENADVTKVVDFGIAKFADHGSLTSATRTGSVLGTPFYMSPEQARGLRTVDHRSDLWSVGVIAYQCLVGRLPFQGESVGDLLVTICTAPLPIPTLEAPDLPIGFNSWFARALARSPDDRFQSAASLAESFCDAVGATVQQDSWGTASKRVSTGAEPLMITGGVVPQPTPEPVVVAAPARGRSRSLLLGLAGVAAALGAAAFALPRLEASSEKPTASAERSPAATPEPVRTELVARPAATSPLQARVPSNEGAAPSASTAVLAAADNAPAVVPRERAAPQRTQRAAGRPAARTAAAEPVPSNLVVAAPVAKPAEPAEPLPRAKPARLAVDIDKADPWR